MFCREKSNKKIYHNYSFRYKEYRKQFLQIGAHIFSRECFFRIFYIPLVLMFIYCRYKALVEELIYVTSASLYTVIGSVVGKASE
jgi:hypothetical protein